MNIKTFVDRPVLATVVSIVITILGILGLDQLAVTQYPDIAPPSVSVQTEFPGASAETIVESVLIPLEEEINGVEDLDYITSTASNTGEVEIQCFFNQDADPDIATVNVQNRISRAEPLLPPEVTDVGITVRKQQGSPLMRVAYYTENPEEFDAVFMQNYVSINVITPMQRIEGVADVINYGDKQYAMRIWLKPEQLAAYDLMPADVIDALNDQSLEAAPGTLGQNSGTAFEYVLQYKGRYKTEEEYDNIIIKALSNDKLLRLKDIADVELGALTYNEFSTYNGTPSINTSVYQLPGSNAQETIKEALALLEEKSKNFPEGIKYDVLYNIDDFLSESISSLIHTFIETFILVFIVVYVFLQDIRATLIPAIAVPVSIVGTFFFLNLFNYSINLLTLFALILAIGIVVDDAIVVVEAVKTKIEAGEKNVKKATISAMREITSAIISITLVMAAVFVPVTFLQGSIGIFYEQFGITLTIAIIISAFNALTLSPALCALFLKPEDENKKPKKNFLKKIFAKFNSGFDKANKKYTGHLSFFNRKKWIVTTILLVGIGLAIWLNMKLPSGFVPTEDRNILFFNIEFTNGTSIDRNYLLLEKFYESVEDFEGIRAIALVPGASFFSGDGSSYAIGFAALEKLGKRDDKSLSIEAISNKLQEASLGIKDAEFAFFQPPQIPSLGRSSGFSVEFLNTGNVELEQLFQASKEFSNNIKQHPAIQNATSSLNTKFPQYMITLDIDRIKGAGLTVNDVLGTLQGYIGGSYAANFSRFNKQYRVYVQALPKYRANKENINDLYVRTQNNEMSPISEFIRLERIYGPQALNRFNLYPNSTINGTSAEGYSSGDALKVIQQEAETLGSSFEIDYSGVTREEVKISGQLLTIFSLSLIMVYFFMAAQFESYIMPFVIIFSLPAGVAGSYLFTWIFGLENNIYFQIALIMLVGLLSKNAILIVEFGLQRRRAGKPVIDAAIDAARTRLRPILMTALAFIVGMVPLIISSGVGKNGNKSIGTGAAGGLLIGTLIGVLVIPVLFVVCMKLQEKVVGGKAEDTDE